MIRDRLLENVDFKAEIDSRCSDVLSRLYKAQCGIHLYEVVGDNATAINDKKYGTFFGLIQRMGLPTAMIELSAVYEQEKRKYALDSLSGIIKYACKGVGADSLLAITPNSIRRLHRDIGLEDDFATNSSGSAREYCDWLHDQLHSVLDIDSSHIYKSTQLTHVRSGLSRTIHARDKYLAHAENPRYIKMADGQYTLCVKAEPDLRRQGPSLEEMDHMIDWAGKVLVLYWAVFSGISMGVAVKESSSIARGSIQRVLRNLSILSRSYETKAGAGSAKP